MHFMTALSLILLLLVVALVGAWALDLKFIFGVIIPYAAIALFLIGVVYRVLKWASAPVPFKITTTCGQQKSLSWVKQDELESPSGFWGTVGRMLLEILFFRSLFRNTRVELKDGPKIVYGSSKWLWAAGLAFHYSFLVVFLRHFKYFAEPTPAFVDWLQNLDSFFQIGVPEIFATSFILIGAVTYLGLRRLFIPQVRFISLTADYFPLMLIFAIATSGICMRHFSKIDLNAVKALGTGLLSFNPPANLAAVDPLFFVHFFFVCVLIAYFPFSKLMHMGGVFLSPTRNMPNNSRAKRHVNPWNPKVKVHTYEEWEDEFRDVMKDAGMPLEKEVVAETGDESGEEKE